MLVISSYCWSLSKSFIPSLVVWSMTKNNAFGGEKQNKKSNGEQSDLCDLEQVTLKPQLQAHHCLTTWLQIWYHSLLWGDSIRKGADLEKQNCLFGVHPAVMGKLTFLYRPKILFKCFGYHTASRSVDLTQLVQKRTTVLFRIKSQNENTKMQQSLKSHKSILVLLNGLSWNIEWDWSLLSNEIFSEGLLN